MPQPRSKPVEDYSIKSLCQALGIFDAFGSDREEIPYGELARIVGKGETSMLPLLDLLVSRGYLEEGGQPNVYRLGFGWFLLRDLYLEMNTLRKVALEEMTTLMHSVHQSVYVARFDRATGKAVYIETVDAPESVVLVSRIGSNAPAHCTAAGKSMLAFLPESRRAAILQMASFEPFTDRTITDRTVFDAHLLEVRDRGFAVDDEEYHAGIRCIAAPIFNCLGDVVASVGIAGYHPGGDHDREELASRLKETALAISERLGYRWEEKAKAPAGAAQRSQPGG